MDNKSPEAPIKDVEKGFQRTPDPAPNSDEHELTGKKIIVIMLGLMLAMFLVSLDRTIIATAVPQITNQFHSLADVGWYAGAYLMTSCATQLIFGRLYTFYSSKTVYLTSIVLFEVGSLICGAAPNSVALIVGRAIAGMASAGIMSGNIILITHTVPLRKRPIYIGLISAVFGVSSVVGPLLGGAFTANVSWRWCFYINLPIGAVSFVILLWVLHFPPVTPVSIRQQIDQLDPFGTLCFLPSIVCLLLALQWGGTTYAWQNGRIIALFVLAGVLFIAFIVIQIWKDDNATVPPRIIKHRSITLGMIYALCIGGSMITLVYFVPIWFQAIKGVSAVQSGIDTIPLVLSLVISSIVAGAVITRTGWYNPWMILCSVLTSIGAGLITTFGVDTGSAKWIGYQVLFGFGLGMGLQQAGLAAQAVLARKDVSTGVSLMFLAQSLGGAVFICVGQSVFNNKLVADLSQIPGVNPSIILATGATDIRSMVAPEDLPAVLVSYNQALVEAFIVGLAVSAFTIIPALGMEWKNVKKARRTVTEAETAKGGESK
ncbi:major facilitator superfamily domain-containing protein [Lipomyces kononenkoae]|uniref:Major facilitator superfamily domain-containing protein n=1 Tax=Lipomyces kononenkoae TaxID=34357 RepID=A0ACC3T7L4_LIPKO